MDQLRLIEDLIETGQYHQAQVQLGEVFEKISSKDPLYDHVLILKSTISRLNGEFANGITYCEEVINRNRKENGNKLQINARVELAYCLWRMGEFNDALESLNQAENLVNELDNECLRAVFPAVGRMHNVFGLIHLDEGRILMALDRFNKSLEIFQKLDLRLEIGRAFNNIGVVYYNQGLIQKALEYYQYALTEFQKLRLDNLSIISLNNIGLIYYEMGNFDIALKTLQEGLELIKANGIPFEIAEALFEIINVNLSLNQKEKALEYYSELEILNKNNRNKRINLAYRLSKALLLKHDTRLRDRYKAEEILRKIVDEDFNKLRWSNIAIKHYCEFLLYELKLLENEEALIEIKRLIGKMTKIGQFQHSFTLLIEALVFQAKISLIEGDLVHAQLFLDQAAIIAIENDLTSQLIFVDYELSNLENEYERWSDLIRKNASMRERVTQSRILQYVKDLQKVTGSR